MAWRGTSSRSRSLVAAQNSTSIERGPTMSRSATTWSAPGTLPAIEPVELLRAIVASAPFATIAFDAEQRVLLWSAGAERLLGWTAAEVIGRTLPEGFVPARDRANAQARIRRTLDGASIHG